MSRIHRSRNYTDTSDSFEKIKELDTCFEQQLHNLRRFGSVDASDRRSHLRRWSGWLSMLMLLIVLPFFVLVRTSIYLYSAFHVNGWLALVGGIATTVLVLVAYGIMIYRRFAGKPVENAHYMVKIVFLVVFAYCCYGLLYLAGVNAKNPEVRSYYRSLHPILRITLATTTLADQGLVVTDTRRNPVDYSVMGLSVNYRSLHYMQPTGYVHAVDIRTINRPEWKNWLTRGMFWLAGLETIRHGGTADHLHVYLPLQE